MKFQDNLYLVGKKSKKKETEGERERKSECCEQKKKKNISIINVLLPPSAVSRW